MIEVGDIIKGFGPGLYEYPSHFDDGPYRVTAVRLNQCFFKRLDGSIPKVCLRGTLQPFGPVDQAIMDEFKNAARRAIDE